MEKKEEFICVGTTLYKIVNRDCHYSPIRGIVRYYTVNKTLLEKFRRKKDEFMEALGLPTKK